jgi:DNA primase
MTQVEQIKSKLDIVDFIGETVKLRKSGRSYSGLCPFHAEKTPSFHVFPDSQNWRCFGACATGGDIFAYVMKRENVEFGEALRILAQRAGVELAARTPGDAAEDARINKLREINEAAARYWHNLLVNSPAAQSVRAYLAERAITEQSIVNFQLGFAPDSWDALSRFLQSRGYLPADIHAAGLTGERDGDTGGGYYDRFRNRLVFPIRDIKGQTLGFGGRALSAEQQPKYLNSPQTPLFDKSSILYAIDMAREAIRAAGVAVIVEGYVDALMAHQTGFKNVVASMGTALTEPQLRTLQRLAKKFILALDADAAGLEAMRRGLSVAQVALDKEYVPAPIGRNLIAYESRLKAEIRVAVLPAGFDPDDLLREDPSAWQTLLDGALPVVDYMIQIVTAPLDLSSARGKSEAAHTLLPLIREMADGVSREHYTQELARRLRMDERTLLDLDKSSAAASARPHRTAAAGAQARPALETASARKVEFTLEEYCLAMFLQAPAHTSWARRLGLQEEDFKDPENREIFKFLDSYADAAPVPDARVLRAALDEALRPRWDALLAYPHQYPPMVAVEVQKTVLRFKASAIRRQVEPLRFLEVEARQAGDLDSAADYANMIGLAMKQLDWTQDEFEARLARIGRPPREQSAVNENTL